MRRRYLIVAGVSLLVGLMIFFTACGMVRNYAGDAVAVVFLYALLSVFVRMTAARKVLCVLLFAVALECLPLVMTPASDAMSRLFLGSTFDPLDLVAYLVSLTVVGLVDAYLSGNSV